MPDGMYIAYTGAEAAQTQLEIIANNVANVGTTGYRRDQTVFDTILAGQAPFADASSGQMDLSPGAHQLTKNGLHAAIDGDGFFAVQDSEGNEFYTRRGDFRVDAAGKLVLPNGNAVLGSNGAVQIPPGAKVQMRDDGTLLTEDGPISKLRIVRFADPSQLQKLGESLISATPNAGAEDVDRPRIAVGFVEASNVNLAAEMVGLIQATRSFEASMRSIRINDELTELLIQAQQ